MAKAPRRERVDSPEHAVKTMIAATQNVECPMLLDEEQHAQFDNIIAEFAKVAWSPHTTYIAALLARTMVRMKNDTDLLDDEGSVIDNARGNPVLNPRCSAIQGAASQIMSMRRTLALHAMAGGAKSDLTKRRGQEKDHEHDNPMDDDDEGLLNTPPASMIQ